MRFRMVHENFNIVDLDRSLAFYDKALGLKEKRRKVGKDGSFILVYLVDECDEFELELTWLADHPEPYNLGDEEFHLAFKVDDYEAVRMATGLRSSRKITSKCTECAGERTAGCCRRSFRER